MSQLGLHLFAQDRAIILAAMNQAVSRLYAYEDDEPGADRRGCGGPIGLLAASWP
jgi:hypothetical protein